MLAWMRSFGDLQRIGLECTGSYRAGLLRYMQTAGVDVLEVTAPDKQDRRRRGKSDDFDAEGSRYNWTSWPPDTSASGSCYDDRR
jgi:transposase